MERAGSKNWKGPAHKNSQQMKRSLNQHTAPPTMSQVVQDLLDSRVEKVADELNVFTCFKPVGKGVSYNSAGYARINFNGGKIVAHKIVFMAYNDILNEGDIVGDVSHLCGKEFCCNPSHLVVEDRKTNISRRGCTGYIRIDGKWFSSCQHIPKCKVAKEAEAIAAPFA